MSHVHYWDALDIPGYFICICGANRHYNATTGEYCIHEEDEVSA